MIRSKSNRRRHFGQSLTECLLIVTGVALVAALGSSIVSSGIGPQSASVAEALAGGPAKSQAQFEQAPGANGPPLADFDRISETPQDPTSIEDDDGSIAFAQGFASGVIDTLLSSSTGCNRTA